MSTIAPQHLHAQIPPQIDRITAPARRRRRSFVPLVAASALVLTAMAGTASAHAAVTAGNSPAIVNTGKIYFGVDGTRSQASVGLNVARHLYGQLADSVPDARMVTMGINGYKYAAIATAGPGSPIYANIVRWADTIGARNTLTFFGFVKEPEQSDMASFGSVAQYLAAYRHVVDIFRSQNLTNVRFVWQMTAFSFESDTASRYYPGDAYVDDVGEDPYNWGGCGPGGPWRDLSVAANPALSFAAAHNKLTILAEFASQSGPKRAAWLAAAQQWFIANDTHIQGAFYFDRPPTTPEGHACVWSLTSAADVAAFRAIVNDTAHFTG